MKICVILYLFGGNMCIYERVSTIYKCFMRTAKNLAYGKFTKGN